MNSNEVLAAIEQIAADSKTSVKQKLVEKFFADPVFRRVCLAAYNPFITFGVKPGRVAGHGSGQFDESTWKMLGDLANRRLTGNDARGAIDRAMDAMTPDSAELLWRVLNKDLRAGFGSTIINKVEPGAIPEFPYMRCSLLKNPAKDLASWDIDNGFVSQPKSDGMYVNTDVDEHDVSIRTRQGNPLPLGPFQFLVDELKARITRKTQLHGELVVIRDGKVLPRQIGNGILNHVIDGGKFEDGDRPQLVVWDQIPLSCVVAKGKCETPYRTRLAGLIKQLPKGETEFVRLTETRIVKTLTAAYQHCVEIMRDGGEGTVIKNLNGIWQDTGSSGSPDQIKLKLAIPVELKIVGYREGEPGKKTEKTFGALIGQSSCGKLEVGVGSGLTDKQREEINADREGHLGAIFECIFNDIMNPSESNPLHSLFLPRFGGLRPEKTEADDLDYIKAALEAGKHGLLEEFKKSGAREFTPPSA